VLLDEMMTNRLAPLLVDHEVSHVVDLGWRHLSNGKLLSLAEDNGFSVMIAKDDNLPYQQSLADRSISLIVVLPKDQTLPTLLALAPDVLVALGRLKPGSVVRIPRP